MLRLVQKKREAKSIEYPKPVYYRAEPELITWIQATTSTEELSQQIEPSLLETKNPLLILETINIGHQGILKLIFCKLMEDRNVPEHKLRFFLDLFIWEPYRILTWKLIEATKKHMDEIDIEQVTKSLTHST